MNDICIPLPRSSTNKFAEVQVKVEGKTRLFNYRLEKFPWTQRAVADPDARMQNLRTAIQSYDQSWELIQIYNPRPDADSIQVLFRQKGT